jgi:hypothetical protein
VQNTEIKLTKQGVRDLGGNSKRPKKAVVATKDAIECEHPEHMRGKLASGDEYCQICGQCWDFDGNEY